jgi:GDP-fucose transporter C1
MLSFAFLPGSRPSTWALFACVVTTVGFVMGVSGEAVGQTSNAGIAWGVWSSLTTALETVVVKHLALKTNVLDLVYATSLATAPVYAVMVLLNGELWQTAALGLTHPVMVRFEKKVFVAGLFNFALSAAAYLQIRVTSPTTSVLHFDKERNDRH